MAEKVKAGREKQGNTGRKERRKLREKETSGEK